METRVHSRGCDSVPTLTGRYGECMATSGVVEHESDVGNRMPGHWLPLGGDAIQRQLQLGGQGVDPTSYRLGISFRFVGFFFAFRLLGSGNLATTVRTTAMATTTSPRVSTDQQLRVDTLTLVNPHALPNANANARAPDLAAHPQARRVSSDTQSQAHGRSSPSLRTITRRTPVPFLLEAFPVPPSHIPPSPGTPGNASIRNGSPLSSVNPLLTTFPTGSVVSASSPTAPTLSPTSTCAPTTFASGSATTPNNPPPSLPPSAPLPPVPGPSPVTPDLFITRRSLQSRSHSLSRNHGLSLAQNNYHDHLSTATNMCAAEAEKALCLRCGTSWFRLRVSRVK
ncbi:hypothetical protein PAXINDRAFT_180214 [Paxillus involutus ATCC 200175]|nr:hypothetical protein PAXINDRAFT_180214 [Paxillus involutus ATCC 200175]